MSLPHIFIETYTAKYTGRNCFSSKSIDKCTHARYPHAIKIQNISITLDRSLVALPGFLLPSYSIHPQPDSVFFKPQISLPVVEIHVYIITGYSMCVCLLELSLLLKFVQIVSCTNNAFLLTVGQYFLCMSTPQFADPALSSLFWLLRVFAIVNTAALSDCVHVFL